MSVTATVIIPTYNGETYLPEILEMLFKQKTDFDFEVLIIDSGSVDDTLEIVKKYQTNHENLRLVEIPNSEFGHGKTRNYAAQLSKGEFVVYLSHDAIPAHVHWLSQMLLPFSISDRVVAVLGKQDPRTRCFPLMKYDIQNVFRGLGVDGSVGLFQKSETNETQQITDRKTFYSDVNSATRRDFLLNVIPYHDVKYAEDMLFGKDVIEAGYIKAYTPQGNVVHSNDIALKEYKMRMFDETIGLRNAGHQLSRINALQVFNNTVKGALIDCIRIIRDSQYSWRRKAYWLLLNPFFHLERWRGISLGTSADLNNHTLLEKHSLERSKKA